MLRNAEEERELGKQRISEAYPGSLRRRTCTRRQSSDVSTRSIRP